MTICIAAICDDGRAIVVAADRMFTAPAPLNLEFEPPISKIEKMGGCCVAMASGNSLYAAELAERIKQHISQHGGKTPKMLPTATFAKDAYIKLRNEKIQEQIINPLLGPDFATQTEKGVSLPTYLKDQGAMYQNVVIQTNQFNLGVDITLAGCDDSGSHIYYLGNPGTVVAFDKLGYNAIGSGSIHAMVALHLGGQSPKSTLSATLFSVYAAKISSEVAPGVGEETEIAVLNKGANVWMAPQKFIDGLKEIRIASVQKNTPDLSKVKILYDEQQCSGPAIPKG
jgi:20S proteasome alpha/beta subunit